MLFTVGEMSQRSSPGLVAARLAAHAGITIADARHRRHWTLRELADRADVSVATIHNVEHGAPASLETYSAIALALGLEPRLDLVDPRRRAPTSRAEDPVHGAMGEAEARRLAGHGLPVAIDEPYQHYQFAGRADVLAWDVARRALLHIENRTRFPNLQEAIGSYNAKRQYLPAVIADRLVLRGGFRTVTHVVAGLWSNEVIHTVRLRAASFRAICPDDDAAFAAWWAGQPPEDAGATSSFVLFDPAPARGRRAFAGLAETLAETTRPRFLGYAAAVAGIGGATPAASGRS